MTATIELPQIGYDTLDDPDDAHAMFAAARAVSPIALGPHGPELLTYDLVRTVLRDNRFVVPKGFGLPAQGITSGPLWDRAVSSLLCLDGAAHTRLRRLVAKAFTPRSADTMRTACAEVIDALLTPCIEAGHCDVVTDISRPYPIPIICALLGVPAQDWQLFSDWADDVLRLFSWDVTSAAPEILRSWADLDDYIDGMVAERRDRLDDDQLSALIRAEVDGDHLDHDELLMLAGGLLMAGTDTTRNQLAAAVEALAAHPDQWELLAAHPELAPNAVEELVRHSPIAFATLRVATEDVEVAGVPIPAGSLVIGNTAAANRDPAVYPDPDRLDITRQGTPGLLTFGGGVHYCLGAHLARIELVEALVAITRRIPTAPHTGGGRPWRPLGGVTGPLRLPVEFAAA